ncbi:F-box/FBD/LRR-repeat protein-like protein [Tanacetum coccineum]
MDRISNLPSGILESILCFLPTEEAVRTSILSKDWRYRWIKIPKLVFEDVKFHIPTNKAESSDGSESSDGAESSDGEQMLGQPSKKKNNLTELTILQVLLMHEGPLYEFTLSMNPNRCFMGDKCQELDDIMLHLSRKNTVKKLKFDFDYNTSYRLPSSLFSFLRLTDLCLDCCNFDYQPTFDGFGSLTSLSFMYTYSSIKSFLHLLSTCPLLKTLTLEFNYTHTSDSILNYTIINLFECLPVIESLSTQFDIFEKYNDGYNDGLSILVLLMKSSPKLEKIEIDNNDLDKDDPLMGELFTEDDIRSFKLEDYSDIWLEHMRELHIVKFKNQGNELNFVKLVLAKSPVLKKVRIRIDYSEIDEDEELQIYQMLLSSPRASPVVDVIVS